jgi:hypothetical protein
LRRRPRSPRFEMLSNNETLRPDKGRDYTE